MFCICFKSFDITEMQLPCVLVFRSHEPIQSLAFCGMVAKVHSLLGSPKKSRQPIWRIWWPLPHRELHCQQTAKQIRLNTVHFQNLDIYVIYISPKKSPKAHRSSKFSLCLGDAVCNIISYWIRYSEGLYHL